LNGDFVKDLDNPKDWDDKAENSAPENVVEERRDLDDIEKKFVRKLLIDDLANPDRFGEGDDYDDYVREIDEGVADTPDDQLDDMLHGVTPEEYNSLPDYFKSKVERYKDFATVHADTAALLNSIDFDETLAIHYDKGLIHNLVIKIGELKMLQRVLSTELEMSMRSSLALARVNFMVVEYANKLCGSLSLGTFKIEDFDSSRLFEAVKAISIEPTLCGSLPKRGINE